MPLNFLPSKQQDFTIYPLTRGMLRNVSPNAIPNGGFYTVEGYFVGQQGLYRRPGFSTYAASSVTPFRMVDIATLWKTTGLQANVLITEDLVYLVSRIGGFTGLNWLYTNGFVTSSGVHVTGSGTDWTNDGIVSGDYIAFDSGASTTSIAEISTVTGDSTISLVSSLGNYTGVTYEIRRSLGSARPRLADWAIHLNKLIIASYYQPPIVYDPTVGDYFTEYITGVKLPSTGAFKANCVCSFADRVWFGGLEDGTDSHRQQRIRWSKITDAADFSTSTAYTDLPYSSGQIMRILSLGRILVVYTEDTLYFGTETLSNTDPVKFTKIDTGGIGLIGPKAVCAWKNGHFFVGQDDIYYVSSSGIEPIGIPVVQETIGQCEERWKVYAVVDAKNTRVCFGFPTSYEYIEKIWSYDYRTKAWSYDEKDADMVASPQITESVTWNDLTSYTWDSLATSYPEWNSFRDEPSKTVFFTEHSNALYQLTEDRATDSWSSDTPISCKVETGDIDLGAPDEIKRFSRLSMTIHSEFTYSSELTFAVRVSTDRGKTWKAVGNLVIYVGKEEGYINFRASGSTIRFEVTSTAEVKPYHINSMVIRASAAGREGSIDKQNAIA